MEQKGKTEGLNEETLRRLYLDEKKSINAIAKIFGCSDEKIHRRLDRYGIKTRPVSTLLDKLDRETLYQLRVVEKKKISDIAKVFKCSLSGVQNMCMRYGFK